MKGLSAIAPITSVTITPDYLELEIGDSRFLTYKWEPEGAETVITWSSENPEIATIGRDGIVTAISPGTAIVRATATNGVYGTATVKVQSPKEAVSLIAISPEYLELEIDESFSLTATLYPQGSESNLTWRSSDSNVASLSEDGTVKGISYGTATIYATADNGVFGTAVVKVVETTFGEAGWDEEHGYTDGYGVYVSSVKIREGDYLTLYSEKPKGFKNYDCDFEWYLDGVWLASGQEVSVICGQSSGWTGNMKTTSELKYEVKVSRTGAEAVLESPDVTVYSRPLTPLQMLRKGDGASCTFIAMSSLSNSDLTDLGYSFVYGYTDQNGLSHILSEAPLRYCHTTDAIFNNSSYRFWVYSQWSFPDGSKITSGLRYMDGGSDEYFDNSSFDGSRTSLVESLDTETETRIFTTDGYYVGTDTSRLNPGVYIVRDRSGNKVSSKKIIIR